MKEEEEELIPRCKISHLLNYVLFFCSVYLQEGLDWNLSQRVTTRLAQFDVPIHSNELERIQKELNKRLCRSSRAIWRVTHDDSYVDRERKLPKNHKESQRSNYGFQSERVYFSKRCCEVCAS